MQSEASRTEFFALQEALAGRYSLQRELGRGGMGIVYLAHEVRLDRPVALKLLPPEMAAQPVLRERFLQEARTAARLSQPNIVPIHAVDEVEDFVFFAMAFVAGESLGDRVRQRGPLRPREAARILREVSWALAYAHAQGVIHRDVKPDNILLEEDTGRALVTDFGIAQVAEGQELTGVGEVLGTAEFMSPEQASGEEVGPRSDLYSLGIVGYYALSGTLPFQGPNVAAILAKQITQAPEPLSTVAPEVPRELAEVLERCLAKNPDERFEDGEKLAEALGRSLGSGRGIPAPLRAFVKQSRQRFRGLGLLGVAVLWFVVAAVATLVAGIETAALFYAGLAVVMGAAPAGLLWRGARHLLRSGFTREDVVLALRSEIEEQKEELDFAFGGEPTWLDRLALGLAYGGLAVATVGTGAMVLLDLSFDAMVVAGMAIGFGGLTSLVASPWAALGPRSRRKRVWGQGWLRFWEGRAGGWIFRLAEAGLHQLPAAQGSHRPTEMAIGLAVDRLFEELPRELRRSLKELPDVVRSLERDAEEMRGRVAELDRLLREAESEKSLAGPAGGSARSSTASQRVALAGKIRKARDGAEGRLEELVAALESVRLGLLRLHAGEGDVQRMTADLGAARELAGDMEEFLKARREVDELLGIDPPADAARGPIPTPA